MVLPEIGKLLIFVAVSGLFDDENIFSWQFCFHVNSVNNFVAKSLVVSFMRVIVAWFWKFRILFVVLAYSVFGSLTGELSGERSSVTMDIVATFSRLSGEYHMSSRVPKGRLNESS